MIAYPCVGNVAGVAAASALVIEGSRCWEMAVVRSARGMTRNQAAIAIATTRPISHGMASDKMLKRAGLAALIVLAPGGFILGAALLAKRYRKRSERRSEKDDATEQ
jgi:hypothetical protein